jgi:prepilin-type N-terminal cleavage/methylation domain-containing protein
MNLEFKSPKSDNSFSLSQRERVGACRAEAQRRRVRENCPSLKAGPLINAHSASKLQHAFTLMEVMIAIGVFCVGVFAILDVVATVMHGARLLNKPMVDAGVIASEFAQTNQIVDGTTGLGDLSEFLGDTYKGYDYAYTANEVESNRLYQVDVAVTSDSPGKPTVSKISYLLYRPLSPAGHLDSGYMSNTH